MMNRYLIIIPAMLLFILSGCQKDVPQMPGNEEVAFAGSYDTSPQTYTNIGDSPSNGSYPVYWAPSDHIGVITNTVGAVANNAKATLMAGAGTSNGKFSSFGVQMAPTDNVFYIYYPFEPSEGFENSAFKPLSLNFNRALSVPTIDGILPVDQTQNAPDDLNSHLSKFALAVATSDPVNKGEAVPFAMTNIFSHIQLNLWNSDPALAAFDIDKIIVEKTGSVVTSGGLVGPFSTEFDGTANLSLTGAQNVIELNILTPDKLTATEATAQKFIVTTLFSGNLEDLGINIKVTVKLKNANGEVLYYTDSFSKGDIKQRGLTKLSVDMKDWTRISNVEDGTALYVIMASRLRTLAGDWAVDNPPGSPGTYNNRYEDWLCAMFIRQFVYSGSNWDSAGGAKNQAFVDYIAANDPDLSNYFRFANSQTVIVDASGIRMDIPHMGASMSAIFYKSIFDVSLTDLSGWAGDLVTFACYLIKNFTASTEESYYHNLTITKMGLNGTTYDMRDLIGDIDAFNICNMIIKNEDIDFATAVKSYYSERGEHKRRFSLFYEGLGGTYDSFYKKTRTYTVTKNSAFNPIDKLYKDNGITSITLAQTEGISKGYTDYIMDFASKE